MALAVSKGCLKSACFVERKENSINVMMWL